jgi:hypothetical protein
MNYNNLVPSGKAVSRAQWNFFKKVLDSIPPGIPRRMAFIEALDVDYDSLPERASLAPKAPPKPQTQAKTQRENLPPLKFPPTGFATVLELFSTNGVKLTPEKRAYVTNLGYLIGAPGCGIMAAVHSLEKKQKLKALLPFLKTIFTYKEAVSFLAIEDESISSLR